MAAVQGRLQAIDIDTSDCRLREHGAFRLSAENEAEKATGTIDEAPAAEADGSTNIALPVTVVHILKVYWYVLFAFIIKAL